MVHFEIMGKRILFFLIGAFVFTPFFSYAIEITQTNVEPRGDFVIMPGREEVVLDPGQETTHYIRVTNRFDSSLTFRVEFEDIAGTRDPRRTVELMGNVLGPYSIREFLTPSVEEFTLGPGERAILPITISIPEDAAPGGLYGAIIVSNRPTTDLTTGTGARLVSRLASLLLVRVTGEVEEVGQLVDFKISGPTPFVRQLHPDRFEFQFENEGSVHLAPYGFISVENILGRAIAYIPIDAYFSLPKSLRYKEIVWDSSDFALGRYTATINLNRGYGDVVDQMSVSYWVIPWRIILIVVLVALILSLLLYYISTRFEIKKKG